MANLILSGHIKGTPNVHKATLWVRFALLVVHMSLQRNTALIPLTLELQLDTPNSNRDLTSEIAFE